MKTCFIVSPIGEIGSTVRDNADLWLERIVGPVLEQYQIKYVRSDDDYCTGGIADSIYRHLENDDLVIADLTGENANVYLEVGYRMAYKKPYILMLKQGKHLPFDVAHLRAVFYNLDRPATAKESIKRTIETILSEPKLPEGVTKMNDEILMGTKDPNEIEGLPDGCMYIQY